MKTLRTLLFGLLALSVAGCGLSDYQSRMDAQRARIQKFDDANQLLGDPIDIPTIPGKGAEVQPAWPFDFYLRLPKGYVSHKKNPYYTNFPFYGYAGPDPSYNVFVAATILIDKDSKERYGESSAARFRELVRSALDDYYFVKTYKSDGLFHTNRLKNFFPTEKTQYETAEVDLITPFSDVVVKIPYSTTSFKDTENKKQDKPMLFRVYYYEESMKEIDDGGKRKKLPGKQIVIVAQRPISGANEQFDRSITAAMGTLDIGVEVVNKRAEYKRLKGS